MTLKILLNIIQTKLHRGETFIFLPGIASKINSLARLVIVSIGYQLRCIIQLNWKRKTNESINPLKGNCSATTVIAHCTVDGRLMYVQIRVRVYWERKVMFLHGCREGHILQALIKTTYKPNLIRWKGGNWASSHYIFPSLDDITL